jgi:toluene monooxygenase system protein D
MSVIRPAGPVLRNSEMTQAIVEAMEEDNPSKKMIIADHNGYMRVEAEDGLILRRATVEGVLGRKFRMQELELIMSAFSGQIEMTTEYARWYFKSQPSGPRDGNGSAEPNGKGGA